MTTTLYDLSVSSYLQSLDGVCAVMEKGRSYAEEHDLSLDEIVTRRLADDMLPFLFQILSVVLHSKGAIQALNDGIFSPPSTMESLDYSALQALVVSTIDELKALDADTVNARAGAQVVFKLPNIELPFTAEDFILSFSLPNLYFHTTTAYDILRVVGVPLSKRDFLGTMRIMR